MDLSARAEPSSVSADRVSAARWAALAAGAVVTAGALAYVKWTPLAQKATTALATHKYAAPSILPGGTALPPAPSWDAAWGFAQSYSGAVWMAVVAGIVIGGAVQALAPQRFFQRYLAKSNASAVVLALVGALPAMF